MHRKVIVFTVPAVILAIALLALTGCSDTDPAPADASKVATSQVQPTGTPEPTAIPEPTVAPEPTPTSVPPATPEPAPTAQASQQESLDDLLQDDIVRNGIELLKRDPYMHLYSAIFLMKWVEDGLSESEREHLALLLEIALELEDLAKEITRTPWVRDGLDEHEYRTVLRLSGFAGVSEYSEEATLLIVDMPWFADGLSYYEAQSVAHIGDIAWDRGEAALSIISMPFLNSLEPSDEAALHSLSLMLGNDPAGFDQIMSHPTIADGITDDETALITPLHRVIQHNPALAMELLALDRALIEDRDITLPLAGETRLTIVRTQLGSSGSMDILERSVRAIEDDMDAPFPTNLVLLLYADALPDGSDSLNAGTNIAIHPKYDVGEDSEHAESASRLLADALAGYY